MTKTKKITIMGLLLGVMMVFSMLERMLPSPFIVVPQISLGLSNIIPMYGVFMLSYKEAILLNIGKSMFVFLLRGAMAGILSFSGGMVSIFLIMGMLHIGASLVASSAVGAVGHHMGQVFVVAIYVSNKLILYQIPLLVILGILLGVVTGLVLETLLPVFSRLFFLGNDDGKSRHPRDLKNKKIQAGRVGKHEK